MPVTSHSTVALQNSIVSCSGQSHLQPLQDTLLLNSFVLQECRRDFIVPDHGAGLTNNFRRQCRSAVFRLQVTHCYSWFSGMCSRTASMGISSAATFRRWSHHCLEVNMGSGNGLMSPCRYRVIAWTNVDFVSDTILCYRPQRGLSNCLYVDRLARILASWPRNVFNDSVFYLQGTNAVPGTHK